MTPDTVVTWKWAPQPGYRSKYGPETVNVLAAMVRRHYGRPHKFVCVTDDTAGIDPRVECLPDWKDFVELQSPHGPRNPACYRRLRSFHPDIAASFGRRFVSMDLDCVVTGDLVPLWDRPEDFVMYGDTSPRSYYNGSLLLLTAGSRAKVWTEFDPKTSPKLATRAGLWGSDQGWISYCLGKREARWTKADGVHSYRSEIAPNNGQLPAGARLAIFHGSVDPWGHRAQLLPWVQEHYRGDVPVSEAVSA